MVRPTRTTVARAPGGYPASAVAFLGQLRKLADSRQMTPSGRLRAWILERLEFESSGGAIMASDDVHKIAKIEVEKLLAAHVAAGESGLTVHERARGEVQT